MASVPASAPFNLSTALAVFGLGTGHSLSELRRSPNGVVPNTGPNAGVPQTAPLSMSQLRGATSGSAFGMSVSNVTGATVSGFSNQLIGSAFINTSGGTPPYTYSTVFKSGSSFTLSNASGQGPSFTRAGNPPAGSTVGVYTATANDSAGGSISQDFTVTDNRT